MFWPWKNSRNFATPPQVSPEITSEKQAQKFHTDDASLPKSGYYSWLDKANFSRGATNQRHYRYLGGDVSCCSISFCYNLFFLGFCFLYLLPLSCTRSFHFRPQHIRSHLYHCMCCTRIQCSHLIFRIVYTSLLPGHHSNTLQRTEAQSSCTQ